jgi:hypothetical protein
MMGVIRACKVDQVFPCEGAKTLFHFIFPARVVLFPSGGLASSFGINLMFAAYGVNLINCYEQITTG